MNNLPKEILHSLPHLEAKLLDKKRASQILTKLEVNMFEEREDSITISLIKLIKVEKA